MKEGEMPEVVPCDLKEVVTESVEQLKHVYQNFCGSKALKGIMQTIEPSLSKMEGFTGRGGNLNAT